MSLARRQVDWPALARERILRLLELEHAVVWPEVEAKLSDGALDLGPRTVDPHHLVNARNAFLGEGTINVQESPTRGGAELRVYHLGNTHRRLRAIADAAGRKRLLHARYRGWAQGTKTGSSLTGTALESVVHASLVTAAPGAGYRLENPRSGQFQTVVGARLLGAVDNGGLLMSVEADRRPAIVIVEAKNLRDWVYPSTIELYQLLAKAAALQAQLPDWPVVPVFVCRRVHYLTREMGAELGFYPIQTQRQYIQPGRTAKELDEVRTELGYNLEPSIVANPYMIRHFQELIPAAAAEVSRRWRRTAGAADLLNRLWRTTQYQQRLPLLDALAEQTRSFIADDEVRVWRHTEEDDASRYIAGDGDL
jgi:hypothetical protein